MYEVLKMFGVVYGGICDGPLKYSPAVGVKVTLNFEVLLLQRGQLDISSFCWVRALFLPGMSKRVAFAIAAFHGLRVLCADGNPGSTLS